MTIADADPATFKGKSCSVFFTYVLAMLEYLYCNSVDLNEELAKDLVILANRYAITGLKTLCEDFLCECLTTKNLVEIANLAEEVDSDVIRNAIIKRIRNSTGELNEREDLLDIPKSILFLCLFKAGHK